MKNQYVIISFDLEIETGEEYQKTFEILTDMGLSPVSPYKGLDLPSTTFLGQFEFKKNVTVSSFKDYFWNIFLENDLKPIRILGGLLYDWGVKAGQL